MQAWLSNLQFHAPRALVANSQDLNTAFIPFWGVGVSPSLRFSSSFLLLCSFLPSYLFPFLFDILFLPGCRSFGISLLPSCSSSSSPHGETNRAGKWRSGIRGEDDVHLNMPSPLPLSPRGRQLGGLWGGWCITFKALGPCGGSLPDNAPYPGKRCYNGDLALG